MLALEEMSRAELIGLLGARDERIAAQTERIACLDGQIAVMAGQVADLRTANRVLVEQNEALAVKLARLEHLLSRNSSNSSSPLSKDDDPGRTPPKDKPRCGDGGTVRSRG